MYYEVLCTDGDGPEVVLYGGESPPGQVAYLAMTQPILDAAQRRCLSTKRSKAPPKPMTTTFRLVAIHPQKEI